MSNEQTTPSPSQLSQRLRAMHAARRLHCSTPDTHQPVYSIHATTERLADLMAAADRLEQLQQQLGTQSVVQVQHLPADDTEGGAP